MKKQRAQNEATKSGASGWLFGLGFITCMALVCYGVYYLTHFTSADIDRQLSDRYASRMQELGITAVDISTGEVNARASRSACLVDNSKVEQGGKTLRVNIPDDYVEGYKDFVYMTVTVSQTDAGTKLNAIYDLGDFYGHAQSEHPNILTSMTTELDNVLAYVTDDAKRCDD